VSTLLSWLLNDVQPLEAFGKSCFGRPNARIRQQDGDSGLAEGRITNQGYALYDFGCRRSEGSAVLCVRITATAGFLQEPQQVHLPGHVSNGQSYGANGLPISDTVRAM
jgi:hypothetical protein